MPSSYYQQIVNRAFANAELLAVEALSGGVSADVYRLDLVFDDQQHRSVVLREHGKSHYGHSIILEYKLLESLSRLGIPVPKPLYWESQVQFGDNPFILMDFISGSTSTTSTSTDLYLSKAAAMLLKIHDAPIADLPELPDRLDPLPEIFDYIPSGASWQGLTDYLDGLSDTEYKGEPKLLHGDFWPENIIWNNNDIAAVLDWEDAAIGDPVSDLACSRLEIRYKFGYQGMQVFTEAYKEKIIVDPQRLALWQIFVAAAANHFMSDWGLSRELEKHMRGIAMISIKEASEFLLLSE